jgi:hypothetical protein
MTEHQRVHNKAWSRIVAKAWADDQFKSRLLLDPVPVLQEHGVEFPSGTQVKVVENAAAEEESTEVRYFTLPAKPTGELSEEDFTGPGWEAAICFCLRCGRCFRCGRCWGCGGCGGCRCGGCY